MFANAQMGGMSFGFPDVCLTPTPAPVPIPYPNISAQPMGVPAASVTSYVAPRSMRVRALNPNTGWLLPASPKNVTCSLKAIRFCSAKAMRPCSVPSAPTRWIS